MSEKIVQFNEEIIKGQLKELVRESVEETLNELLEKEAESLTQAARYERSEARQGYRSGHYDRSLTTTSGDVTLHMPRLKGVSFETAIIERYRRRESSVEEALIEMYLAGVSVRRVEDITEALWGSKVSPATISELNKKAYVHIEDWRNRPLQGGHYSYVYVDDTFVTQVDRKSRFLLAAKVPNGSAEAVRDKRRLHRGSRRLPYSISCSKSANGFDTKKLNRNVPAIFEFFI